MKFSVKEIEFFERSVKLRMPFRFGVVTLIEAPQAFVSGGASGSGSGDETGARPVTPVAVTVGPWQCEADGDGDGDDGAMRGSGFRLLERAGSRWRA